MGYSGWLSDRKVGKGGIEKFLITNEPNCLWLHFVNDSRMEN